MKFKITDFIFTDKTKAWEPLIDKNKNPFFMLHLEVKEIDNSIIQANQFWKWISKFYVTDESEKLQQKIKVGETYDIEYSQTGIYKNIVSIRDLQWNIII